MMTYLLGGLPAHEPAMLLSSPVVSKNGEVSQNDICQGDMRLLPLRWRHVPKQARSLALVMIDQSAKPKQYLWTLYNIPTHRNEVHSIAHLLRGERFAKNSWGQLGYHAPCSMTGPHHYVIKLYALKARFYFHAPITTEYFLKETKHRTITTAKLKITLSPRKLAAIRANAMG